MLWLVRILRILEVRVSCVWETWDGSTPVPGRRTREGENLLNIECG